MFAFSLLLSRGYRTVIIQKSFLYLLLNTRCYIKLNKKIRTNPFRKRISCFFFESPCMLVCLVCTLEERSDFPDSNGATTMKLAKHEFHEKERNSSEQQHQKVRHQKRTWHTATCHCYCLRRTAPPGCLALVRWAGWSAGQVGRHVKCWYRSYELGLQC